MKNKTLKIFELIYWNLKINSTKKNKKNDKLK